MADEKTGPEIVSATGKKVVEAEYETRLWLETGCDVSDSHIRKKREFAIFLNNINSRPEGFRYVMARSDIVYFRFGTQEVLTHGGKVFEQPIQMEQIQYVVGDIGPYFKFFGFPFNTQDEPHDTYVLRSDAYNLVKNYGKIGFRMGDVRNRIDIDIEKEIKNIGLARARDFPYEYNIDEENYTIILLDMNNSLNPVYIRSQDQKLWTPMYENSDAYGGLLGAWNEHSKIMKNKIQELEEKIRLEIQNAGLRALCKTA